MVKNKIKRCVPLLLALVVLISCLPVLPVSAASYVLAGSWRFSADLPSYSFVSEDIEFVSYDRTFYSMEWDGDSLLYDDSEVYSFTSGWINSNYRFVEIVSGNVSADFYSWFTSVASVYNPVVLYYSTTIYVGSSSYVFTSTSGSSPDVTITVTDTGCTMMSSTTSYWTYVGSDTFLGLSLIDGAAEADYPVGTSFTVSGAVGGSTSYSYYAATEAVIVDPDPDPDPDPDVIYNTEITFGSMSFVCSGTTSASPDVVVTVTNTGVILSYGSVSRSVTLNALDASYSGLSVNPDATAPDFPIGYSFTCPGSAGVDVSYQFFPVFASGYLNVVFIDGQPYPFYGSDGAAPDVSLIVDDNGCVLTDGSSTQVWLYSGSDGVSFGDFAVSSGWENEGYYPSFNINADISVLAAGGAYSGKYYTYDKTWRIYQSDNGVFQIDAGDYFIRSVVIEYSYANSGTLMYNDVSYSSGAVISVNDHSAIFKAGNLYDGTNGQVRIKSISVNYSVSLTDDVFLGFSSTADGTVVFSPGNSYALPGTSGSDVSWELFSKADDGILNYTTIVHMPDALFTFSSTVSMPVVTVRVTEYGVVLTDGTKMEYWYPNGVLEFLGLAITKGAAEPDFLPGTLFTVFGQSAVVSGEEILEVYYFPVYGEKSNLLPGADFASWLVVAVGGFLAFELVPGFSLQDILSFVLLFGILLWVLKIALR